MFSKFFVARRAILVAFGLVSALGSSLGGADASPSPFVDDERSRVGAKNVDALRYDEIVQKSAHNAYERFEPLFDQLAWHGLRSIELDIHETKSGELSPHGDWFVYHEDVPFLRRTTCTMLSDCLGQLAAFHRAVPAHEPITLFIDLKDRLGVRQTAEDLDALLAKVFGRAAIVAPGDLMNRCPDAISLRQAVAASSVDKARDRAPDTCSFPTMGELRGKFIVAVTGGTACDRASSVNAYAAGAPRDRLAFLAPNVDDACAMHAYDERPDIVFVNMPWSDRAYARQARERGLIARVYGRGVPGGLDALDDFEMAQRTGAQHLATDMVNADASVWANAWHIARENNESSAHFVQASSGDIWNGADSFWFSYEVGSSDAVYSTFVSVPSSHVEPFAKACLMARASEDPGAPNVSVCRMFANRAPRMQVRTSRGGATTEIAMTNIQGVSEETPAFLRLEIHENQAGSDVVAEGSIDGEKWQTIGHASVDAHLPLRGTAVSSHGAPSAEAVFGAIVRETPHQGQTHIDAFPLSLAVGEGSSGSANDNALVRR
ncbi:MAG: Ca2+-dependent phosphoinositide-specific phospholipase C [Polyangiaceae bacterium]|nr:Ca2+-dependent phosphoinositide-specific phospholipase C [Polyangiaceae bacterium]